MDVLYTNETEDIVDAFNINEQLYIVLRSSGIYISGQLIRYPITGSGIEYYSAQVRNNIIIVYSTIRPVFFDTTQNIMSLISPFDKTQYIITSSTERDPLDTFESSKNDYYTRENETGETIVYRKGDPIFSTPGHGYRTIVYDPLNVYIYFMSQATSIILRTQDSLYDTFRIPTIVPFCLDTNSTSLTGYRWFNGEDIRVGTSGTLYAILYTVLTVKNGMASLRF